MRCLLPLPESLARLSSRFAIGLAAACAIVAPVVCAGQQVIAANGKWLALNMDAGSSAACGVTRAGTVACWSIGFQLGERSEMMKFGSLQHPHVVPKVNHAVGVAAGETFACAWTKNGEAWCWGANDSGQLGDSTLTWREEPRRVHTPVLVAQMGVSDDGFACLLSTEGRAYCWGYGLYGRVDPACTNCAIMVPTPVAGGHVFTSLSVGPGSHVCALDRDGVAWCWGENDYGQASGTPSPAIVGKLESAYLRVPARIAAAARFDRITSGGSFTCARDVEARARCWGYNRDGSLGVGDTVDHEGVQSVRANEKFASVDAGLRWVCGTTSSLRMVCWGSPSERQRTTVPAPEPGQSGGPSGVAIGGWASCVLDGRGTIRCWTRSAVSEPRRKEQ